MVGRVCNNQLINSKNIQVEMPYQKIIEKLPYGASFLFVDELVDIDMEGASGKFTFRKELDFFKSHFKDNPVTPGVILTECCAQIGLVAFGIFLLLEAGKYDLEEFGIGFSSSEMEFYKPVFPDETVTVTSKKIYFRFNKLKCEVKMHNAKRELVCKGTLSGMLNLKSDA